MGKLSIDNLDDRREIVQQLARLSPQNRLYFDRWCCQQCYMTHTQLHPQVLHKTVELAELARWDSSASERLTVEVYMDILYMAYQFNLDLNRATLFLEQLARRG